MNLRDAFAAELVKIRTVRSTGWSLLISFVCCAGIAVLSGLSLNHGFEQMDAEARADFDPVQTAFVSLTVGQIALVVFGVLTVSGEYTSGMIRASLTAVPRRGVFFGAKIVAGSLTALAFSVVTCFGTFFAAQTALGPHGTTLGAPGALRATVLACAYLTLICAVAMCVAAMLRRTALTLGIMIPILFLDSQGLGSLPGIRTVAQYLPDQAWVVMTQATPPGRGSIMHRDFGPWTGLAILVLWTGAAFAGGLLAVRNRDT